MTGNFASFDPGYKSYIGFLLADHATSNPTLIIFCRELLRHCRATRGVHEGFAALGTSIQMQHADDLDVSDGHTELGGTGSHPGHAQRCRTR